MSLFFIAIFLLAAPIGIGYGLYIFSLADVRSRNSMRDKQVPEPEFKPTMPAIAGLVLMLLYISLESYVIVPAGHIGIQVTYPPVISAFRLRLARSIRQHWMRDYILSIHCLAYRTWTFAWYQQSLRDQRQVQRIYNRCIPISL